MAISATPTLLSLDEFTDIMEISPYLFNQLDLTVLGYETKFKVWFQKESTTPSTIARDTVANAIADAEKMLAHQLEFWPAPYAIVGERIEYPRPWEASWANNWYDSKGRLKSVRTMYRYVNTVGVYQLDNFAEGVTINFTDEDGDGKNDTFTSTATATTVTDESEIVALFDDDDRSKFVDGEELTWRIRPVKVSISGGFVTVSGPIWLVVDPDKQYRPVPVKLDPIDPLNFVDTIKLSRLYIDEDTQGSLVYKEYPCSDDAISPCDQIEYDACFSSRGDVVNGVLVPAMKDWTCWPTGVTQRAPDEVKVNYISGYPLKSSGDGRLDPMFARIISRLAATLLPERALVTNSETQIDYWRGYNMDRTGESLITQDPDQNSPFGMRRGALYAWQRVMEMNAGAMAGAVR